MRRRVNMPSNGLYLESLLDLFHEHIAICSETVHGEYSAVRPRGWCQWMPNWVLNCTDSRNTLDA